MVVTLVVILVTEEMLDEWLCDCLLGKIEMHQFDSNKDSDKSMNNDI